jgi:hypothetical protein
MPDQQQIDHWRSLVDGHNINDESVAKYCARKGVRAATFYSWRQRLADKAEFLEVREVAASSSPFELRLTNGIAVGVPANFNESSLRRLMTMLNEVS